MQQIPPRTPRCARSPAVAPVPTVGSVISSGPAGCSHRSPRTPAGGPVTLETIPEHVTRINEAKTPTGPGRPGASTAHITASTEHLSADDIERLGAELQVLRERVMSTLGA